MGFLRVLGLVFVNARLVGQIDISEPCLDRLACTGHGFGGHINAVGPHIGDKAGLIQTLGDAHGLLCAHAEFAAGLLLQGRGHERWRWVAGRGLCLDRFHNQIARADRLHRHFGLRLIAKVKFIELLAGQRCQPRFECLPARVLQQRLDGPVFLIAERLDFHLTLNDDAQANRLDPPGRFCSR